MVDLQVDVLYTMDQPKISYSLVSGTPIFSGPSFATIKNWEGTRFHYGKQKKSLHPQKSNELIPNNDGPWKMYLRLQSWPHSGYQVVRFQWFEPKNHPTWNPEHHLTSEPSCSGAKHVNRPGIFHLHYHLIRGTYNLPPSKKSPTGRYWTDPEKTWVSSSSIATYGGKVRWSPRNGARVGILTKEGLLSALKELGLAAIGNAEEAPDLQHMFFPLEKS